jgi:glycosyltransferase involved in cell wall biosynthesis
MTAPTEADFFDTVEPIDEVRSTAWETADPEVSVIIATHNRADLLDGLFGALAAQADAPSFEVLVVDDGSTDHTWATLTQLVAATDLAATALLVRGCGGPSLPRNTAVARSRGRLLAITDDDCLPDPHWLAELSRAAGGGEVVQGSTYPTGSGQRSPWDRTIEITSLSGLWESCNLALPRALFDAVGGFPVLDLLRRAGRGFGEDTVLGAAAARLAGGRFAPAAVVRHRWVPGDFLGYLETNRRLAGMPALLREVPELRSRCYLGWFRNRRSAECDLAVAALVLAVCRRRPSYAVAALPWLRTLSAAAAGRWGRPRGVRIAQEATADLVALSALAKGSAAAGTLLL